MIQATDKTLTPPPANQYGDASKTAFLKHVRLNKEESAFVYGVFEASEGILAYSTLDAAPGQVYRDLELQIPAGMLEEAKRVLDSLGELVYDLGWTKELYEFKSESRAH